MADRLGKIRLFVTASLSAGARVPLDVAQAHYLFGVMRREVGDRILVFNGVDGEWRAEIVEIGRKGGALAALEPSAPQRRPPDLWLLFAPIKRARTDFIVERATEMGAARIAPVITRHTNAERVRLDRLRAHAIEAAEQCGETHVPEIVAPERLEAVLDGWDGARRIMFCDEARDAASAGRALAEAGAGPWAVLIGPEGGFATEEAERLRGLPFVTRVTMGPRVLRADTAAVAALALWQSAIGDWR